MIQTKYDRVGDVAVVTMANPLANTFTMELGVGLEGAVRRAASEEARALVLQTDGSLFCGGADTSSCRASARTTAPAACRAVARSHETSGRLTA